MIWLLGIAIVTGILMGLGALSVKHDEAKRAAALKNAKRQKPNAYVAAVEAKGHRVQVVDLDTGEVYEPKDKS